MKPKESVLVVDDEVEICLLLAGMLEKLGFKAQCVHTIADASKKVKEEMFNLVFLDLNLPDGLGFHLIEKAKKSNPDMKIIIISAYDSNIERKRAEAEGANYFLPKPFNRQMIREALAEINATVD
jgi:CheY-like chemotaxis protein